MTKTRAISRPRTALLAVLLLGLAGVLVGREELLPRGSRLGRGSYAVRKIEGKEIHTYRIPLQKGELVRVVVDQQGADVEVTLHEPSGSRLRKADFPVRGWGPEEVFAVADHPGSYGLAVTATKRGTYRIRIEEIRPATARDQRRIGAADLFDRAETWSLEKRSPEETLPLYEEALRLWSELAERRQREKTLFRIGLIHASRKDQDEALAWYRQLLPLWRGSILEAELHNRIGLAYRDLGETGQSIASYKRVLELPPAQVPPSQLVFVHNNLGSVYRDMGLFQEALNFLHLDPEVLHAADEPFGKSALFRNLGHVYQMLGSPEQALDAFETALEAAREAEAPRMIADARRNMATALRELRRFDDARKILLEVLESSAGQDAMVLNDLGLVELDRQRLGAARVWFERAVHLALQLPDKVQEAQALANLAYIRGISGEPEEGLRAFARAEEVYGGLGDLNAVALICYGRALVLLENGSLREALAQIERSLQEIEKMRAAPASGELRAAFLARRHATYAAKVEILMALDGEDPAAGHGVEAFNVSETAHGRTLLETLDRPELRAIADPGLLRQQREIEDRLQEEERGLMKEIAGDRPEEDLARRDVRLREIRQSLEEVDEEIRRQDPRYSALLRPRSMTAGDIRTRVLDDDTLLVSYFLGPERSFVWILGRDLFLSQELAGQDEIEGLVRAAYDDFSRPVRRSTGRKPSTRAGELSRAILEPIARHLGSKRLLIVPDGALHYIPFAALPDPRSPDGGALIRTNEIVVLPSASVLDVLRREAAGRPMPSERIAVLADPVFDAADPRVRAAPRSWWRPAAPASPEGPLGEVLRTVRSLGIDRLERLEHTKAEAEAISDLVPDRRWVALGFDASREAVTSPRLGTYRTIHFATHGFFVPRFPHQSGIVLSMVDAEGKPRDGFLRLSEIYSLHLPVDLVVLSACQTALGEEVRGEGLIGLTRGFQHAGASRVMVSLWSVNDEATTELMKRFYAGFEGDGLPAAAALRQAQIAMSDDPDWGAPYHWAAFVLHGDWR